MVVVAGEWVGKWVNGKVGVRARAPGEALEAGRRCLGDGRNKDAMTRVRIT